MSDTQTAYLVAYVAEFMSGEEIREPLLLLMVEIFMKVCYNRCKRCVVGRHSFGGSCRSR